MMKQTMAGINKHYLVVFDDHGPKMKTLLFIMPVMIEGLSIESVAQRITYWLQLHSHVVHGDWLSYYVTGINTMESPFVYHYLASNPVNEN